MRAFWSGSISFGLVNIPVNLYPATKAEQLSFHFLHEKDLGRIHNERICDKCGESVSYHDLVRGFEYEKDQFTPVTKEDFQSAADESARNSGKTIEIIDFVDEREIDPLFFDKPYYMAPDKKGEKAYALLAQALKRTGKVGIAKVVFHTREHLAAVRAMDSRLALEVMHFASELKRPEDLGLPTARTESVGKRELEMAEELIERMAAPFEPEKYHDTYRESLARLLEEKREGKVVKMKFKRRAPENVIDIMSKLKASLAQKERPQRAQRPKRRSA